MGTTESPVQSAHLSAVAAAQTQIAKVQTGAPGTLPYGKSPTSYPGLSGHALRNAY